MRQWLRAVLVFIGLGALCLTSGCAVMQSVGGELLSPFADVGAESAMIKNIKSSPDTTGILLVSAGIQDEFGADKTHSVFAASISKQGTSDETQRVASFNDSLVVFQGLEPGEYSIVQLTDDRSGVGGGHVRIPVGPDPWNSVTVTAGGVYYLGKLTSVYAGGNARAQAWNVDTEAGAWAAVIDRYDESPWIPTMKSKIGELWVQANEPPMVRLERTISHFEQTTDVAGTATLSGGLPAARVELDKHLQSHPTDRGAGVLSARLRILELLSEPVVMSPGEELPDPFPTEHDLLDGVLADDPNDAEAHYWKARMYGFENPGTSEAGRMAFVPVNLGKAIEHASAAVELSPESVDYRSALALYLVEDMRWDEAKQALDTEEGRGTALYSLLTDGEALVFPEGAVYSREDSDAFGEMQLNRGRIPDLPQLRVSVYVVPMAADEVEAFYSQAWDGLELIKNDPSQPGGAQYLRFGDGGLTALDPGASSEELEAASNARDGILFSIMEWADPDGDSLVETSAGHPLPDTFGTTCCYLFFVNQR